MQGKERRDRDHLIFKGIKDFVQTGKREWEWLQYRNFGPFWGSVTFVIYFNGSKGTSIQCTIWNDFLSCYSVRSYNFAAENTKIELLIKASY